MSIVNFLGWAFISNLGGEAESRTRGFSLGHAEARWDYKPRTKLIWSILTRILRGPLVSREKKILHFIVKGQIVVYVVYHFELHTVRATDSILYRSVHRQSPCFSSTHYSIHRKDALNGRTSLLSACYVIWK